MKYKWFEISHENREEWESLCPPNEYRVVDPTLLPSIIPIALKNKLNSALIIASGEANGIVFYMINLMRVDTKDAAIDQQPFGLAFVGDTPIPSGCLIDHGNWQGRTIKPPSDFWSLISKSGIRSVYPLAEMPRNSFGNIRDLQVTSQEEAFNTIVLQLKRWTE